MGSVVVTVEMLETRLAAFKTDFTSEIGEIMNKRFDEFFTKLAERGKVDLEEDKKDVAYTDAKDSEENDEKTQEIIEDHIEIFIECPSVGGEENQELIDKEIIIEDVDVISQVDEEEQSQEGELRVDNGSKKIETTSESSNKEKKVLSEKYVDPIWLSFERKFEDPMSMFFERLLKLFWFFKQGLCTSQVRGQIWYFIELIFIGVSRYLGKIRGRLLKLFSSEEGTSLYHALKKVHCQSCTRGRVVLFRRYVLSPRCARRSFCQPCARGRAIFKKGGLM